MYLLLALVGGFLLSVVLERFLVFGVSYGRRHLCAWLIHLALWVVFYTICVVLSGRIFLSLLITVSFLGLVVVVSNAKYATLREPFTYQDFRYLKDAIQHPRLYLPFLGLRRALFFIVSVVGGFGMAWYLEGAWIKGAPSTLHGVFLVLIAAAVLAMLELWWRPDLSFEPSDDIAQYGFWNCLWLYKRAASRLPVIDPLEILQAPKALPDLVAVQSESFFDPRLVLSGIRKDILRAYDEICAEASFSGGLFVPAWGANTVRSEFAFLVGEGEERLGVHRFNPYGSILKGMNVVGFPSLLKKLGYRTVCIHPYSASFYSRDRIFPLLGFDEFIDESAFNGVHREGRYVGDVGLSDKVLDFIEGHRRAPGSQPLFVFVITMENHGPFIGESFSEEDLLSIYDTLPADSSRALTHYLAHLRNADQMIGRIKEGFKQSQRPLSLCWFGDHVPGIQDAYQMMGSTPAATSYFVWKSNGLSSNEGKCRKRVSIPELAMLWLKDAGFGVEKHG